MTEEMDGRCYLEPTQSAGAAFLGRNLQGEVIMLNLLRFREVADYTDTPELAPAVAISGREAYQKYIDHTLSLLQQKGGDLLFQGGGGEYLIGPPGARWDHVMLVRHRSVDDFLSFASNEEYLAGMGKQVGQVMQYAPIYMAIEAEAKTATDKGR